MMLTVMATSEDCNNATVVNQMKIATTVMNDSNATNTNIDDADCDEVITSEDCNDNDATVVNSNVDDADCDGVNTSDDCNDSDDTVVNTNVDDADCDEVITSEDCNDNDATVVNTNVDDADCDEVITSEDCNDNDATVVNTNINDADCDGLCDNGSGTPLLEDTDCDEILIQMTQMPMVTSFVMKQEHLPTSIPIVMVWMMSLTFVRTLV